MEFFLPVERRLKAAPFLGKDVEQHRMVHRLEKLECFDQQRKIMSVDRPEVFQPELLKENGGPQHALGRFFGPTHHFDRSFPTYALDEPGRTVVQVLVVLVRHDAVQITGDGAHVEVDRPLIVVEHDDQTPCLLGNVVEGLERDSVGKGGVAGHGDHVLVTAGHIPRHCHAQGRGKRGSRMPGAVAVVLAFRAQHEPVQPPGLADGFKAVEAPGEQLVNVSLVADVKEDLVGRCVKDGMKGQCEFHHAQVGAQVATGLGKGLDQDGPNLIRQFGHFCGLQPLEIGGRFNRLQQVSH